MVATSLRLSNDARAELRRRSGRTRISQADLLRMAVWALLKTEDGTLLEQYVSWRKEQIRAEETPS